MSYLCQKCKKKGGGVVTDFVLERLRPEEHPKSEKIGLR